jgi:protein TonB
MEEVMFDSLALEDPRNSTRTWTTLMSFTLETAFVGMLIAAPLAFTDKLPLLHVGETIIAPSGQPARVTQLTTEQKPIDRPPTTEFIQGQLVYSGKIPVAIAHLDESQSSADSGPVDPNNWVIGGTNERTNSAVQNLVRLATKVPPPMTTSHLPLKISHLDPGFLIQKVQPIYPRNAIITKTEGTVVLAALIDTQGRVTQLHAISGHPFLIPAAIDAVQQWRYKPYILNGSPVEVETQVSVIFSLDR